MSQVHIKAAILVGGPLDGNNMEVDVSMHDYMELVYDLPAQVEMIFDALPRATAEHAFRTAIYKEQADGTHWKYYSG